MTPFREKKEREIMNGETCTIKELSPSNESYPHVSWESFY